MTVFVWLFGLLAVLLLVELGVETVVRVRHVVSEARAQSDIGE